MTPREWMWLGVRSVLAGAGAGLTAGGLIFFGFGFVGLEGGDVAQRVANGWEAVLSFGLGRGLIFGVAISLGLMVALLVWSLVTDRPPQRARPWLTVAAALAIVGANTPYMRDGAGWDEVAVVTVAFMALMAAAAVWWVSPWVLRPALGHAPFGLRLNRGR